MLSALTAAASGIAANEQKKLTPPGSPAGKQHDANIISANAPTPTPSSQKQLKAPHQSSAINMVKVEPSSTGSKLKAPDNGRNPAHTSGPKSPAASKTAAPSNPSATPSAPPRRRRGRQKVRNIVKIPGTDRVEIYCIHGCGCKYETKVFSSDRAAWHKALRCINAHESQRCARNKNSTRCYKNRETKKERKPQLNSKRKVDGSVYPDPKMQRTAQAPQVMPSQFYTHPTLQFAQQQLGQQLAAQQYAQLGMNGQIMLRPVVQMAAPSATDPNRFIAGSAPAQGNFTPAPVVSTNVSQQCSQYCRYRRAVAELMLENSRLKQDCARLKDLLNSVSGHLQQSQQLQALAQQQQFVQQPHPQQQHMMMPLHPQVLKQQHAMPPQQTMQQQTMQQQTMQQQTMQQQTMQQHS